MTRRTLRNLLPCLTPRRLWNLLQVFASYRLSLLTGRVVVWGLPYTLTIEPTNRCNLQCPECPSGNGTLVRPLGSMDLETFKRIVDELQHATFYLQLFFQGEPFLNRDLIEMVRYARRHRMYVAVSTNAHFLKEGVAEELSEAGLQRLIVSLDGITPESYREYRRGGRLDLVLQGMERVRKIRSAAPAAASMEFVLQFLVTRQNEEQIADVRALALAMDAELNLKTMQVYSLESAERFLPRDERYRRYRIAEGALQPKSALRNRCVRLWERSVVTWDGVVVPCCFDKNAEYRLGSMDAASFAEVWTSTSYRDFRERILHGRREVPMCTNCTEGLKVYR